MPKAMEEEVEEESQHHRWKLSNLKRMIRTHSMIPDRSSNKEKKTSRSQSSKPAVMISEHDVEERKQQILSLIGCNDEKDLNETPPTKAKQSPEMKLMKERFVRMLLGEDMTGRGMVSHQLWLYPMPSLTLQLRSLVKQKRLAPMESVKKTRWRKELRQLLSVTDHIVEFVPSKQSRDGISVEIMTKQQRTDLHMNIPALRKLDDMLIDCLDEFKDRDEFSYLYVDEESEKGKKKEGIWSIPSTFKVSATGLSQATRQWLQSQKDSVNQVLKASIAINAHVISEMAIPDSYIDSLPKNGRDTLGDSIYRYITVDEYFDPDRFFSMMDLASESSVIDLKNKIEASVVIWKRKLNIKDGKPAWGSAISLERREQFEERAETILRVIKQKYPGIPQSSLEISKIQNNQDVGKAVLESYSRTLENLALTLISRIDNVLQANAPTRNSSLGAQIGRLKIVSQDETTNLFPNVNDESEAEVEKDSEYNLLIDKGVESCKKPANLVVSRKFSYTEKLHKLGGLRSPTARH